MPTTTTTNMSLLSMMEERLPPGFRFHPRDEELICDYLAKKISGDDASLMMIDVDLNKCEPWDLPEMACIAGKEWYFFSLRDRKYATGQRTNRATVSGYWKATGKDRMIARKGMVIGMRKTLVFYQGRAPKGTKTDWVMHEFRMEGADELPKFSVKEDWVLCRVFYKSRGVSSKPSMETCYDDTGSSSLPPLTDTHIAFNQTPLGFEGYKQVPCFSNFRHNPNQVHETSMMARSSAPFGGFSDLGSGLGFNPLVPCDQKVMKAVLNQLTKFDSTQKREANLTLVEGSIASYLTETGQSSMWSTF